MSNSYSLDRLRADVEREFAPVRIELSETDSVVLRNLLRLPKKEREEVYELISQMETLGKESESTDLTLMDTTAEIARQVIAIIADNKALGRKLVSDIKEDLPLSLKIFEMWMEATQPGEAEPSPN